MQKEKTARGYGSRTAQGRKTVKKVSGHRRNLPRTQKPQRGRKEKEEDQGRAGQSSEHWGRPQVVKQENEEPVKQTRGGTSLPGEKDL